MALNQQCPDRECASWLEGCICGCGQMMRLQGGVTRGRESPLTAGVAEMREQPPREDSTFSFKSGEVQIVWRDLDLVLRESSREAAVLPSVLE